MVGSPEAWAVAETERATSASRVGHPVCKCTGKCLYCFCDEILTPQRPVSSVYQSSIRMTPVIPSAFSDDLRHASVRLSGDCGKVVCGKLAAATHLVEKALEFSASPGKLGLYRAFRNP